MAEKEKTGLVLEGGGMRGIYTAGVLDVFMEKKITFDGVIGVSAGAIHGASFVSGQHGRSLRYYKKYCCDRRFMSLWNLLRTGDMVDREFCYHDLPEFLDPYDYEGFVRSGTEFYVTCSNVETGKAEYIRITDMDRQIEAFRASASLPYVSRLVRTEGMKLLDGGCTDSIPLRMFMKMGFRRNVVVLTRHRGYEKKPEHRIMASLFYSRYPKFAKALKRRHLVYNKTLRFIDQAEEAGKAFVIRPSRELPIGRSEHSPEKLQEVYDIGRQDAEECLARLTAWLAGENSVDL